MANTQELNVRDYIAPLYMNGLHGRVLRLPAPAEKRREILFIYGHHSTLERWWGLIQDMNQYGAVTAPDLPGFGGMDSFYKIGDEPSLDNLADYLAAFVKMRYSRRRVSIVGLSFGFIVATRMLQRHPQLVKKVDMLVSVVGFSHQDDFTFTKRRHGFYKSAAKILSYRVSSTFFRNLALHPVVLRAVYSRTHNAKKKFAGANAAEHKQLMDAEVHLWHANDLRTHMATTYDMLTVNNCKEQVALPVWHISTKIDQYFDRHMVEQHMRVIFTDFHFAESKLDKHAPSVIATVKDAAPLIPKKIRRELAKA